MPSPLVCKINEVHQYLNDFLLPFPIRWNNNVQCWEKETSRFKVIRYYTVSVLVSVVLWLQMCVTILFLSLLNPGLFDAGQILMAGLQIAAVTVPIVCNFLTLFFPDAVIKAANNMAGVEVDPWFIRNVDKAVCHTSQGRLSPASKIFEDPTGLVVFVGIFVLTSTHVITPIVVVYNKYDPIYLLAYAYGKTEYTSGFLLDIVRQLVSLWIVCVSVIPARCSVLLYFYLGMALYRFFALILKIKPEFEWSCVIYFRRIAIMVNDVRPLLQIVFTGILSSFFTMLVFAVIVALLGVILGDTMMQVAGVGISAIGISVLMTTFFCSCHIYEDSRSLLHVWADVARRKKDRGFLKLTVQAMRPISLPAGNVGIFDRDITMNYFASVVDYVTSYFVLSRQMYFS